ncbi:MAG: MBL fold metallo-hydrolase [Candidatus Aminicenantes bacterium]|jgi:glyoxylase-like metal-dependent hydrolase (beta-lactamase superfamily II)
MKYESVVVGALETNCYLAYCRDTLQCAVIDPGAEADKIFRIIHQKGLKPTLLINTHGHVDHVGANRDIKDKFDIPLYIHEADRPMLESILQSGLGLFLGAKKSPPPDDFMEEGDELTIGHTSLKVMHTPGHSPGSVSLMGDGCLFSGDTLFCGGVGRTDLPGGSWEELERSIREKIFTLPPDTLVLTGHGPSTTVDQETKFNPFIR